MNDEWQEWLGESIAVRERERERERERMGIWGAVSSTADSVKKRFPDPQPVKNAGCAAYSAVTARVPDLKTPIAGILWSSYDHSRSALSTVKRVKDSMPDSEVLKKIAWNLTDITIDNYSRFYTFGLPVYRIVVEGLVKKDVKAGENTKAEELQEMKNRMERLESMLLTQGLQPSANPYRRCMAGLHQNPEDVIRVFMTKGFTGGDFLHDQVVSQHDKWKRDALLCPVLSPNRFSGILVCDDALA